MLQDIEIQRFKSFESVRLKLAPLTLLVGPNASGKSNFFDALLFLKALGHGWSVHESLNGRVEGNQRIWSGVRGGAQSAAWHHAPTFALRTSWLALGDTYTHRIEVAPERGEVERESLDNLFDAVHTEDGLRATTAPGSGASSPAKLLSTSNSALEALSAGHWIPTFRNTLQYISTLELDPRQMRGYSPRPPSGQQPMLASNGENISAVLWSLCKDEASKLEITEWISEVCVPPVEDISFSETDEGDVLVRLHEQDGTISSARTLSDGTLYFLGLIAALKCNLFGNVLLIDELGSGLHPARLGALAELITRLSPRTGGQIIASTHSPELLRAISELYAPDPSRNPYDGAATILAFDRSREHGTVARNANELQGFRELEASKGVDFLLLDGWLERAL